MTTGSTESGHLFSLLAYFQLACAVQSLSPAEFLRCLEQLGETTPWQKKQNEHKSPAPSPSPRYQYNTTRRLSHLANKQKESPWKLRPKPPQNHPLPPTRLDILPKPPILIPYRTPVSPPITTPRKHTWRTIIAHHEMRLQPRGNNTRRPHVSPVANAVLASKHRRRAPYQLREVAPAH